MTDPHENAPRRPRAVAIEEATLDTVAEPEAALPALPVHQARGFSFLSWFLSGLGGLVLLSLGLWAEGLVSALIARNTLLGYGAMALAGLAVLGLLGMIAREWRGVSRLAHIGALRERAEAARAAPDKTTLAGLTASLLGLYAGRPDMARARAAISAHRTEVMDDEDRLALLERELMSVLDGEAKAIISASARRIALITAVSPRALVDLGVVIFEAARLSGRIARLYGARPGLFQFMRMLKAVIAHIAVTGGMAAADDLVGQVVGHGLAARLSARLGEGLVNGLMTARVGIAAMDALRPMPFAALARPSLTEVTRGIASLARTAPSKENKP